MSHARRIGPSAAPLTVIGGDTEDDVEEAPTVLATDLEALGITNLRLLQPVWEQPEGVSDAETAPTGPSPVASEPRDPSLTFSDEREPYPTPIPVLRPSPAAESQAPMGESEEESPLLLLIGSGVVVAAAGMISLGLVIVWWLS